MLIDTHCHIHETDYPFDAVETLNRAIENGVGQIICVGTSQESSRLAVDFAAEHDEVYAAVGIHPHNTKDGWGEIASLIHSAKEKSNKLVAVGEIGLDYFYTHSPREVQIKSLEEQIDMALKHNLPIIFHVREAFADFWPVLNNFSGIRGVLHSFTDSKINLDRALGKGLYIGVNGISTFTRDAAQRATYLAVPLERLLIETDAPLLTPVPFRGRVNEPAFVKNVALFHATDRNVSFDEIAEATTANARALFAL